MSAFSLPELPACGRAPARRIEIYAPKDGRAYGNLIASYYTCSTHEAETVTALHKAKLTPWQVPRVATSDSQRCGNGVVFTRPATILKAPVVDEQPVTDHDGGPRVRVTGRPAPSPTPCPQWCTTDHRVTGMHGSEPRRVDGRDGTTTVALIAGTAGSPSVEIIYRDTMNGPTDEAREPDALLVYPVTEAVTVADLVYRAAVLDLVTGTPAAGCPPWCDGRNCAARSLHESPARTADPHGPGLALVEAQAWQGADPAEPVGGITLWFTEDDEVRTYALTLDQAEALAPILAELAARVRGTGGR